MSGEILPELGSLSNLRWLDLWGNQLTVEIPPELASLPSLTNLYLHDNSSLSGPLPGSFTGLSSLNVLWLQGTGLCAPKEAAFQAWLGGIGNKAGVVICAAETSNDCDSDDGGLIQVANLAQLNAIRWDLGKNCAVVGRQPVEGRQWDWTPIAHIHSPDGPHPESWSSLSVSLVG